MLNLKEKMYWVWLSLIPGIGSVKKQKLLEKYKSPEKIFQLNKNELMKVEGIGEKIAKAILDDNYKKQIEKHISYMQKNEINIISIQDNEYPQILKEIYDPPISLYIRGDSHILNQPGVAIVGCRECTEYGKQVAKYFSYQLANEGVCIISGLAKGIDAYSHIGCLGANGKTIAVVGNGLDTIYPKENLELARKILEKGGAIVSEYPLGTKPDRMNFPARNRIISGMSKGILVVEAKEKSGTLLTVDFALEQGRDVFVVPGNINSVCSVGTNDLIKQGAKMVTTYEEVLENVNGSILGCSLL